MKLIVEYKTKRVINVECASRNSRTKLNTGFPKKRKKFSRLKPLIHQTSSCSLELDQERN